MKNNIKEVEKRIARAFKKEMGKCIELDDFHFNLINVKDLRLTEQEQEEINCSVIEVEYDRRYYIVFCDCDSSQLEYCL